jgi:ankyrin repeat protein
MIFYGASLNNVTSADKSEEPYFTIFFFSQQAPFYFLNSVPASIRLPGRIDLSFFRNQSIVSQYRYKLEIPGGVDTEIDRNLILWSQWTKNSLAEIKVPRLDQEGGYKLIVEYMTPELGETKRFEKPFYVYRANSKTNADIAESKTATLPDRTPAKTTVTADKITAKATPVPDRSATGTTPSANKATTKETTKATASTDNVNKGKESVNDKQATLKDAKEVITPGDLPHAGKLTTEPSKEPVVVEKSITPNYDKLLAEAIEKKDSALFRKSIQNGAGGSDIKDTDGGNIFHIIDETVANEDMISILKDKGIPINETDDYGNSPLHVALLKGEIAYARSLINQGADLNMKNKLELTPLHLAAFLNDDEAAKLLLNKGADIDIKGNSGYTPLHIAAEMNHPAIAKDLLFKGAKNNIRTDQKLTPKSIAKIQRNYEMYKLIGKKGYYTVSLPKSTTTTNNSQLNSVKQNPKYDFNLPYDKEFAKKRQFNKVAQFFSVPVFIIGTSVTYYLNHEANNYYSLYKHAESENLAKLYYDKTKMYDTYTYISGGVSLVSIYGFIHSTIRKKSISNKMFKTFN